MPHNGRSAEENQAALIQAMIGLLDETAKTIQFIQANQNADLQMARRRLHDAAEQVFPLLDLGERP